MPLRNVVLLISLVSLPGLDAAAETPDEKPARLSIAHRVGLRCGDCDGIALGDLNGDGRLDLLTSNGKGGTTFWFGAGETIDDWTRHEIHRATDPIGEIEGNDLGDFDGDGRLEAVSLNQRAGEVLLHRAGSDPRGTWTTVVLRGERPLVQASLVTDVDGDGRDDLIFTWEGRAEGRGGVHWLKFSGSDLLDPTHWTEHVMTTLESAWWIAPRRVDLNGNGRETDLVVTARNLTSRNPGARPGVYWLEEPSDPTQPWKLHTIDRTLNHPLHVDVGDFSGDGNGKDVVVGGFETGHLTWYRYAHNWQRIDVPLPKLSDGSRPNQIWNVKAYPLGNGRPAILAPATRGKLGALLAFEPIGQDYRPHVLLPLGYNHPMDDRIVVHDLTGDGQAEVIIPDSGPGVDRLWIMQFDIRAAND